MNNREKLIELMSAHALERHDVAELLKVTRDSVDRWLLPHGMSRALDIPDMAIELLTIKLERRAAAQEQ